MRTRNLDLRIGKQQTTMLIKAAEKPNGEVANTLIDLGAKINCINKEPANALQTAIRAKNEQLAIKLLDNGSDVDKSAALD